MTLRYATTTNANQKTLDAALNAGVTASATFNNTTGIQNKAGVFVVDRVDTAGALTPNKREYIGFTGTSGSTVVTLTRNIDGGGSDQDHAVGAIVEFGPDAVWADGVMDALDNLVDSTGAVDSTKIPVLSGSDATTLTTTAATNVTLPTTGTLATLAGTETLSAKRITPRIVKTTDDATAVIDVDVTDQYELTAVANATTFTVTGTPTDGQKLIVRITDAGVTKALTWTGFTAKGATPPANTTAGKTHYVGFIYSSTDTTWDCVVATVEA